MNKLSLEQEKMTKKGLAHFKSQNYFLNLVIKSIKSVPVLIKKKHYL